MNLSRQRELTLRSVLTGMVIGALLTPCNVYSGLKIGWSFNMSIAAALLSLAFWRIAEDWFRARPWGLYENNINQTAASSAASIISGGLVAPIPALTILTGQSFSYAALCLWVFAVSALGIVVAVLMRNPMLVRAQLVFPAGVATAETVRELYGHSHEARVRIRALFGAGAAAAALKLSVDLAGGITRFAPSLSLPLRGGGAVSLQQLGLAFDPSLLMLGFGAIIGTRAGVSLLLGALIAWPLLGNWGLGAGWITPGDGEGPWFGAMVEWLIWPGVTLMATASLSSLAFMLLRARRARDQAQITTAATPFPLPWRAFALGAGAAVLLAVLAQRWLFAMPWGSALFAVALSLLLAAVAARVVGETGIPPIGAIGKIAQLGFGVAAPGNLAANLMGANVTGGAAGQCADLLNDLRTGLLLGANARAQIIAQCFGVLTGSLVGSAVYLALIPDPASMLLTAEWPAPAVATWKAVAEVLSQGLQTLPAHSGAAMAFAAAAGVALSALEALLPPRAARWLPSGTAMGLAFVIPAWISISLCLGALLAAAAQRLIPNQAARLNLPIAAGFVAGESLAGIGTAFASLLRA